MRKDASLELTEALHIPSLVTVSEKKCKAQQGGFQKFLQQINKFVQKQKIQ